MNSTPSQVPSAAQAPDAANQSQRRVLIIEDDVFLGDVLEEKLSSTGFATMICREGVAGLRAITTFAPHLILLDLILPGMDGYGILEAKAKDAAIVKIPVIVISNSGQPVEMKRLNALGVTQFLIKAKFSADEVVDKVKSELLGLTAVTPTKTLDHVKILWVEDDKFLGDILSRKITTQGAELYRAKTGAEAFKILEKQTPDIIILDVMLPVMDGFEVLQTIKMNAPWKNIPVLMLSNLGQNNDVEKSKLLGAEKFLIKAAVTLDEIIRTVADTVNSHKK